MFMEYDYRYPYGTLNMMVFKHCTRFEGIFRFNDIYTPEAIRLKETKGVVLTMLFQGFSIRNNVHDCKLDLKFKDGSIRTAETLVTMNLSSRS